VVRDDHRRGPRPLLADQLPVEVELEIFRELRGGAHDGSPCDRGSRPRRHRLEQPSQQRRRRSSRSCGGPMRSMSSDEQPYPSLRHLDPGLIRTARCTARATMMSRSYDGRCSRVEAAAKSRPGQGIDVPAAPG
jgi:hypothetical protein